MEPLYDPIQTTLKTYMKYIIIVLRNKTSNLSWVEKKNRKYTQSTCRTSHRTNWKRSLKILLKRRRRGRGEGEVEGEEAQLDGFTGETLSKFKIEWSQCNCAAEQTDPPKLTSCTKKDCSQTLTRTHPTLPPPTNYSQYRNLLKFAKI